MSLPDWVMPDDLIAQAAVQAASDKRDRRIANQAVQKAFAKIRSEILSIKSLDNDQINSLLGIIDNHTPEWV
jgi:hypothetical protein